jgi:peptidoglycan hydrolase-like protein with peptidoglycan-binding domain
MAALRRHLAAAVAALLAFAPPPVLGDDDGLTSEPVLAVETGRHGAKVWVVDAAAGLVASAGEDKTIRLWDAETGAARRVIHMPVGRGDVGKLYGVALSPDGEIVAAGGTTRAPDGPAGQPVHLFATATGEPLGLIGADMREPDEPLAWPPAPPRALGTPDIRQMQAALARLGYFTGIPNGIADPDTVAAARRYASVTGARFDGAFSPDLADGLRAAVGAQTFGPDPSEAQLSRRAGKLAFSPDGRYLAVPMAATAGVAVFDRTRDWERVAWDRGYADHATAAVFLPDGALLTISYDGAIRRYAAGIFAKVAEAPALGRRPASIALAPDGALLAVGHEDTTAVALHDPVTLELVGRADTEGIDDARESANLARVRFLPDGRLVAAGRAQTDAGERLIVLWDGPGTGERQLVPFARNTVADFALGPGGALIVVAADPTVARLDPDGTLRWRSDGALADFRGQRRQLRVSDDGYSVAFGLSFGFRDVVRFDIRDLKVTENPDLSDLSRPIVEGLPIREWENTEYPSVGGRLLEMDPYEDARGLSIRPDLAGFVIPGESSLRAFTAQGDPIWSIPVPGDTRAATIAPEREIVVAAHDDGTVRWYRLSDGGLILSLFVHAETLDWVLWTPEGYFTAAAAADHLVGWRLGGNPATPVRYYPIGGLMDDYRRPDLVKQVLAAGDSDAARISAEAESGIAQPVPPEVVEILPPTVDIGVLGDALVGAPTVIVPVAIDAGSQPAIDEVSLWIEDAAGTHREAFRAPGEVTGHGRLLLPASLEAGDRYLSVAVIAGTEIAEARIAIEWGDAASGTIQETRTVHVLAVGVSRYQQNHLSLRWAHKDAEDFVRQVIESGRASGYRDVKTYFLVDEEASRESVMRQFGEVRDSMREGDVALVLFSGHGVREGEQYYLLPFDTRATSRGEMTATALPYNWVRDELRAFAARGPTLLFIDACRSGLSTDEVEPLDVDTIASDLRRANRDGRNRGVIVFASSSGNELSLEDDAWQNGAFTKAVVETFAASSEQLGGSGGLTLEEIKVLVKSRVARLTGGEQRPQVVLPDPLDAEMVLFSF